MAANSAGGETAFSWLRLFADREGRATAARGGVTIIMTAEAALTTGDVCFASATPNQVNKSATSANYASFVGVVVGGTLTNMRPMYDTGIAAAGAGQQVLVQISGVALMKAEGTITIGTHRSVISTASTAGKVIAGTTQGLMLGTPLTDASSGTDVVVLIDHR